MLGVAPSAPVAQVATHAAPGFFAPQPSQAVMAQPILNLPHEPVKETLSPADPSLVQLQNNLILLYREIIGFTMARFPAHQDELLAKIEEGLGKCRFKYDELLRESESPINAGIPRGDINIIMRLIQGIFDNLRYVKANIALPQPPQP